VSFIKPRVSGTAVVASPFFLFFVAKQKLASIWSDWKHRHSATLVLSRNTGYSRKYDRDPYQGYASSRNLYFPVANNAPARYHPKEWVLGLAVGETYKAYPFIELNKHNKSSFTDSVNGSMIIVHWNNEEQSGFITDEAGVLAAVIQASCLHGMPFIRTHWYSARVMLNSQYVST